MGLGDEGVASTGAAFSVVEKDGERTCAGSSDVSSTEFARLRCL